MVNANSSSHPYIRTKTSPVRVCQPSKHYHLSRDFKGFSAPDMVVGRQFSMELKRSGACFEKVRTNQERMQERQQLKCKSERAIQNLAPGIILPKPNVAFLPVTFLSYIGPIKRFSQVGFPNRCDKSITSCQVLMAIQQETVDTLACSFTEPNSLQRTTYDPIISGNQKQAQTNHLLRLSRPLSHSCRR